MSPLRWKPDSYRHPSTWTLDLEFLKITVQHAGPGMVGDPPLKLFWCTTPPLLRGPATWTMFDNADEAKREAESFVRKLLRDTLAEIPNTRADS